MDYIKEYKSFINSHYLSDGIRITVGAVIPALILNHFHLLSAGAVVSLGVLITSIPDTPGPIQHRKNALLVSIVLNTVMALLTGFITPYPLLLGIFILVCCFALSMIGVYGPRVNSIGLSALLIMVLSINHHYKGWDIVINAACVFAGGAWYMLLSLLLYSFRPYKLAQQALGDCIMSTAAYLRLRASFYEKEVDYEATYLRMMEQQIAVHEKQNLVRELLFKSRLVIKSSTVTGRTLVMIFTDIVDLFERTMSVYNDYKAMHEVFGEDEILEKYRRLILELSNELDEIGIAVKSGEASKETGVLAIHIRETNEWFGRFRDAKRTAENVDDFISMRHILNSIEDIAARIHTLHLYTNYDKEITQKMDKTVEYDKFVTHQSFDVDLLKDNLSFTSNNFRHAIRISVATLAGYIVSLFLPVGHSYWILLTIVVILKPAYSLTKKRNYQRLIGTILGAMIGLAFLYFIKDTDVLFVLMLLMMIGTYSLVRTNYMLSVIFMTPYILLMIHLLGNASFQTIISDRVMDTAIGSVIAFFANLILLPAWEHEKINSYMLQAAKCNREYFRDVALAFTGHPVAATIYKVSRKNAFVALANLSDAFNRMMAEPKNKQKNIRVLHQFVVFNHTMTSHIATLSSYTKPLWEKYNSPDFLPLINNVVAKLNDAEKILSDVPAESAAPDSVTHNKIQQRLQQLLETRRAELKNGISESDTRKELSGFKPLVDQFNFIENIAGDIRKTTMQWMEG